MDADPKLEEASWNTALFKHGIDIGDYSEEKQVKDASNRKMFILVDEANRENEGDLILPAQMVTPEAINFMAKYGRGLICLALTKQRINDLELPLMNP